MSTVWWSGGLFTAEWTDAGDYAVKVSTLWGAVASTDGRAELDRSATTE